MHGEGKLLILLSGCGRSLNEELPQAREWTQSHYRVLLDGVQQGELVYMWLWDENQVPDILTPVSIIRLADVEAGTHNIQVQFRADHYAMWIGGQLIASEVTG